MANFELVTNEGNDYFTISLDGKKTSFLIYRPLTGRHAIPWPKLEDIPNIRRWTVVSSSGNVVFLQSPYHTTKPSDESSFISLGQRIISGEARWGPNMKIYGGFRFIPRYWEWLEDVLGRSHTTLKESHVYDAVYASLFTYDRNIDTVRAFCEAWCPKTNSLHTRVGEASITLWDLYAIGGLPIVGRLYDETIPYPDELNSRDPARNYISSSCQYLFSAFHIISSTHKKKQKVTLEEWTAFWFKDELRYIKPRTQQAKKSSRPKYTGNPNGTIGAKDNWPNEAKEIFSSLAIPEHLVSEVYLAAFLSCWLSAFVLPDRHGNIRPTTFKPASLMASGQKVCLAIPVLASIYKGLNDVSHSSTPGSSGSCFPLHYLFAWMAHYFDTHFPLPQTPKGPKMTRFSGEGGAKYFTEQNARTLIHSGSAIPWNGASFVKSRTQPLSSSEQQLDNDQRGRFAAIRPCFLTLRCNNNVFLEPYSPHRFCRQFGYQQMTPGDLDLRDIRSSSLEEGLKHWRLSIYKFPQSKALIPALPANLKTHTTPNFDRWWRTVHQELLIKRRDLLIESTRKMTLEPDVPACPMDAPIQPLVTPSKDKDPIVITGHLHLPVKRPIHPIEMEDSTNESEQHWNRRRKKAIMPNLENPNSNVESLPDSEFFRDLDQLKHHFLGNSDDNCKLLGKSDKIFDPVQNGGDLFQLPEDDNEISEGSAGSVSGPTSFDLIPRKNAKGKSLQNGEGCSRQFLIPTRITEPPAMLQYQSVPSVTSVFQCDEDILACQRKYLSDLWKALSQKLSKSSLKNLGSIEDGAKKILQSMKGTQALDIAPLTNIVTNFFNVVRDYEGRLSSCSEKISEENRVQSLAVTNKLLEATIAEKNSVMKDAQASDSRILAIDEEVKRLNNEREIEIANQAGRNDKLSQLQATIIRLEGNIVEIRDRPVRNTEDEAELKRLEGQLEAGREELVHFKLFF